MVNVPKDETSVNAPGDDGATSNDQSLTVDNIGLIRHAAEVFLCRGWMPIPVKYRDKRPVHGDWPNLQMTPETIHEFFKRGPLNIGVQLGTRSGGLVDIDLDCHEAVELAEQFLPATGAAFGRPGKPNSHPLYRIADTTLPRTRRWQFKQGKR